MVHAKEVLLYTHSDPANLNAVILTGNHNTFALRPGIGVQKTDNFNPRRIAFAIGNQILDLFCASNFGFILMCSYKNKKTRLFAGFFKDSIKTGFILKLLMRCLPVLGKPI